MNNSTMIESNKVKIFYKIGMPAVTLILLLVVGPILQQSDVTRTSSPNFFIRLLISIWYCLAYIQLSRLSQYKGLYPNKNWEKSDVSSGEKIVLIAMGIFWGVGNAILTWLTIKTFISSEKLVILLGALINGIITAVPIIKYYWKFKI